MKESFVTSAAIETLPLWKRMEKKRLLFSFEMEITARCNNNCRHCYINLPANDKKAIKEELSLEELKGIIDEAISLGAFWCLLTGGEPLLREDFFDIYLYLKKKGILVSVFTNAALINHRHIRLFKEYPPRDIEITVYGVTEATYEKVTRRKGSFSAFMRGLNLLLQNGIKVRFKAMALRSNVHELTEISRFCRKRTKDYFRFDPLLHLRFDGNQKRNLQIKRERLSPQEIATLEQNDKERFQILQKNRDHLINTQLSPLDCDHLFHCGAGNGTFSLSYNGLFRLCSSLWHTDCIYDLKKGNLTDAWFKFVSKVRGMRPNQKELFKKCRLCPLINLCLWCPAHNYLETGKMDAMPTDYFCEVARARAEALK